MFSNKFTSWLLFIILCLIWGSSFILMKISKEHLSGMHIASIRIFSAGLVLVPFGIIHLKKIPRDKIVPVISTGISGNLFPALMYAISIANGLDSSLAAILNSLTPICVVIIGFIFFKNKIKRTKLAGIIIGFVGLCLLFLNNNMNLHNAGYAALVLLATVSYGFNVNFVSNYLKGVNPVHIATVSLSLMTIPSLLILWQQKFFALSFSDPAIQKSIGTAVLLGIGASTIGTILFYLLIKKAGGLFASLVTYGVPFIAVMWGLVFGENITGMQIACLGIILVGVYLANRQ